MTELLQLKTITKSFGGLRVSENISFDLKHGDRVALIGPNGAGKTTLVNIISGDVTPSRGSIFLNGEDITHLSIPGRVSAGVVRTFQVTRLFSSLTVAQNVAIAVMQKMGLTKRLFSNPMNRPDIKREWEGVLELLGIAHLSESLASNLAYGQQRLLDLAIGLALKPNVLLLDEPAAGVSSDESPKLIEVINRLPPHIAILMIEHDMDLVFRFAQRMLVMANGRLIFKGTPAEVTSNSEVRRAYLGKYENISRAS